MNLANRIRFSSTLDKSLHNSFKKISNETRIPLSKLLDEAVKDLIDKYSKKNEPNNN